MAGYLHLSGPPDHAKLGVGKSQVAVTRLRALRGFSEPTEPIPVEKAFSIHLHLRANLARLGAPTSNNPHEIFNDLE